MRTRIVIATYQRIYVLPKEDKRFSPEFVLANVCKYQHTILHAMICDINNSYFLIWMEFHIWITSYIHANDRTV